MNDRTLRRAAELQDEKTRLEDEALEIFKLVVAEWESDPMSVQCFDLRIVKRATYIRALLADVSKRLDAVGGPFL